MYTLLTSLHHQHHPPTPTCILPFTPHLFISPFAHPYPASITLRISLQTDKVMQPSVVLSVSPCIRSRIIGRIVDMPYVGSSSNFLPTQVSVRAWPLLDSRSKVKAFVDFNLICGVRSMSMLLGDALLPCISCVHFGWYHCIHIVMVHIITYLVLHCNTIFLHPLMVVRILFQCSMREAFSVDQPTWVVWRPNSHWTPISCK